MAIIWLIGSIDSRLVKRSYSDQSVRGYLTEVWQIHSHSSTTPRPFLISFLHLIPLNFFLANYVRIDVVLFLPFFSNEMRCALNQAACVLVEWSMQRGISANVPLQVSHIFVLPITWTLLQRILYNDKHWIHLDSAKLGLGSLIKAPKSFIIDSEKASTQSEVNAIDIPKFL